MTFHNFGRLAAATLLLAPALGLAALPTLWVNDDPIGFQAPSGEPSYRYTSAGEAGPGMLEVYTAGFLPCASVYASPTVPVTMVRLQPRHQSARAAAGTGVNSWLFPSAVDVRRLSMNDSEVRVNSMANGSVEPSTLACHPVSADGIVADREGIIFRDGFEVGEIDNPYQKLVNWVPVQGGFQWSEWREGSVGDPWTQVPLNACEGQSPLVGEGTGCAAITGVRTMPRGPVVRQPVMRTATVTSQSPPYQPAFIYAFRVDVRYGVTAGVFSRFELPRFDEVQHYPGDALFNFMDAFDQSYLSKTGSYCIKATLPENLADPGVCDGATVTRSLTEAEPFVRGSYQLDAGSAARYAYVIVTRAIIAGSAVPQCGTPVVSAAVFAESAFVAEGADRFRGDDVVFGFQPPYPSSAGGVNVPQEFPWMGGCVVP